MTDSDIIKVLEAIANEEIGDCSRDCAFYEGKVHDCAGTIAKKSLDLIQRQQAEIERLKDTNRQLETDNFNANMNLDLVQKKTASSATTKRARWRW